MTRDSDEGRRKTVSRLLDQAGRTYADESGITLADRPMPLFQLLTLSLLLSTRISAHIAVGAAAELFSAGLRTADSVAQGDRRTVIAALGRAHYRRYDESTATRLRENAELARDRYRGDLRDLADESGRDVESTLALLEDFAGIGPVGAAIFVREVQDVWTWARPYFDERARGAAHDLGLPTEPRDLVALTGGDESAPLAAALVRVSLDADLRESIRHE
ncbi:endonuclease [Rhodococcus sp. NPDC003322]